MTGGPTRGRIGGGAGRRNGSRPGEPGAAGSDRPGPDDGGTERGRVIPFAPRRPAAGPHRPSQSPPPASDRRVADLARYETGEEPDDYRHRMITNVAALLVLAALTAGGLWIASTMADMRKNQDCVLSGRRGCTPVPVPAESPRP